MSIVVEMSHEYLSLEHLVHAMALASVNASPRRPAAGSAEEDEAIGSAMLAWESELREMCSERSIKGYDAANLTENDWLFLNVERDAFYIGDLNAHPKLRKKNLQFVLKHDEEAKEAELAALSEYIHNKAPINWQYWVMDMQTLTAAQAVRLMFGLDPDVYPTLDERPNKNNVADLKAGVQKFERLALNQGRDVDTPEHWLTWAQARQVPLHRGFRHAVKAKIKRDAPPEFVAEITPFRFEYAGYTSFLTKERLEEELAGIERRIAAGKPRVADAAIALARFLDISAEEMLAKLTKAYHAGLLVVRDPRDEIPITQRGEVRFRPWLDIVFDADMDALLRDHWRVTYTYSEAAHPDSPIPEAEVESPATTANPGVMKHSTKGRKRDELTPVIEAAQHRCKDPHDPADVWNNLLVMAKEKHPPLLGYVPDEGIQYGVGDDVYYLTKKNLGDRIRRSRERANAR